MRNWQVDYTLLKPFSQRTNLAVSHPPPSASSNLLKGEEIQLTANCLILVGVIRFYPVCISVSTCVCAFSNNRAT